MQSIESNYFIARLESEIDTSLMLVAHNAYWSQFKILERKYDNFHVYIFGSRAHIHLRKENVPKDCDFILLDSPDYFSEDAMDELRKIGQKMSLENNKRVTIGYVYFIPSEERTGSNISREIKIISLKNNIVKEEVIPIENNYNLIFFASMIAEEHTKLEDQKVLKRV